MKENDIRPKELFDELLRLVEHDVGIYFKSASYKNVNCPACEGSGEYVFTKNGFKFEECPECKTLFVNPRPEKEAFDLYYSESSSTKYWATTFYKATESARRKKIWKPKAIAIKEKIDRYAPDAETIIDVGGGYGIFMEEFKKISDTSNIVIEPSPYLAEVCQDKGLDVLNKFVEDVTPEDLPDTRNVLLSFELFEHLHSPGVFLSSVNRIMSSGDIFIFSTLSSMGVDIQVLWEDSKSISPPMHVNFLNPKSVKMILGEYGFEINEITTPGKLDINIMENSSDKIKDRFWRNFLEYSDDKEKERMQTFISENLLSSHMMIVCTKI